MEDGDDIMSKLFEQFTPQWERFQMGANIIKTEKTFSGGVNFITEFVSIYSIIIYSLQN